MYVDDENINLKLFHIRFQGIYHVITCHSGMEGLQKLEEYPDVLAIISDMRMPGMNGVEFIQMVKQKNCEIPCYILTGFDISQEISDALDLNLIESCFHKPMDTREISVALEQL